MSDVGDYKLDVYKLRKELEKLNMYWGINAIFEPGKTASESFKNINMFFDVGEGTLPKSVYDVWDEMGFTQLEDVVCTQVRSKKSLSYGYLHVPNMVLPDFPSADYYMTHFWMGFEAGPWTSPGILCFFQKFNSMYCQVGGSGASTYDFEITSLLPADAWSAEHEYTIIHEESMEEFYIDNDLVAVLVEGDSKQLIANDTQPYTVGIYPYKVPKTMPSLLELDVQTEEDVRPEVHIDDPTIKQWRLSDGSPSNPRTYRLYDKNADTLLTDGTYDTGVWHFSHPFPLAGYKEATVYFRSDTAMTDGFNMYMFTQTGATRILRTETISANTLEHFTLENPLVLGKIGFQPDADGASITDAEVVLR